MRTAAQLRALLDTPELLDAASATDLRAAERLRRQWPADLVATATQQAELRQRAREKFTRADVMLFTREGLEQATSEVVARHRARRFASVDATVLDMCCGIGGDLLALAAVADRGTIGVDRDERHALIARYNARAYGPDVVTAVADIRDLTVHASHAVFIDPARRTKAVDGASRRGGYSPALDWSLVVPAHRVCIKAAPGVDKSALPPEWEVEFVAVGRDLKEAALWSPAWATASSRATVLPGGDTLVAEAGCEPAAVRAPGRYLLDPSPAVTRAGAVADLAAALGAWQIDRRIAFLSADSPLRSPFGRSFTVEASLPFGVKALNAELRRLDIGVVELRRRGLAGDVEDLMRRLRAPGARQPDARRARRATVMLTRVVNKPWAIVCTQLETT